MKKVFVFFFAFVLFTSGVLFANGNSFKESKEISDFSSSGYSVVQSTSTITTFPWTEGFEGGALPTGWTQLFVSGSNNWTYQSGGYNSYPSGAHTGSYNAFFFYNNYYNYTTKLVTPDLDLSSLVNPQLTFWHAQDDWGGDQDVLHIYYRPVSDTNWILLASYTNSISAWTEETISLVSVPSTEPIYIAFEGHQDYGYGVVLDDIVVEAGPTCPRPLALSVSNIQTTSADLSWTAGGSEATWDIEYKLATDTGWTLISGVNTNPYNLPGLTPSLLYNWRVKAVCSTTDESLWSVSSSFRTACDNITILPYIENFDSYGTDYGTFPSCWYRPTTYDVYPALSTSYFQSSPASLMFNTRTSTMALTPAIDINIETLQVSFWLKMESTSSSGVFQVGVMANDTDITTFDTIVTIIPSTTDWTYYEVALNTSQYTGSGYYIAFEHITTNNYWYWLDDVMVDVIPTCPRPDSVRAFNTTTTSFDLSWRERGTATVWNIEYGPTGFTQGTGTVITGVTNPYPLTGLAPSTAYDVYVQSDCGGSDISYWSLGNTFRTLCGNINAVPYTENFDTYGTNSGIFPDCWARPVTYNPWGTAYPSIYAYTYYSSPASLMFETSTSIPTYALTPAFDISIDSLQVSFWLKADNISYSGAIQIGVMANDTDITTFDTITTIIPSTNDWTYYEIALNTSQYVGPGYHVAFKHANPTYYYYLYYLDDVTVDYIPDCIRPDNVVFSNATINSIDAAWNERGSATSWNIEYGPTGFTQGTGTTNYGVSNPYTITGLAPSTLYDFYVQSDCGSSNSYWTDVKTFTTTQIPYIVPGIIDFEDTLENANWSLINGAVTNKWYISSAANNTVGGANALFISNTAGASNVYDNNSTSNVWAYRDIYFTPTTGEYQLNFDWRNLAESCCDYIYVFIGDPVTVEATSDYSYDTPAGATLIGSYNGQSTWQSDSMRLGPAYSGTTKRLFFLWHNDSSLGSTPPGAIDNIKITDIPCATINNLAVSGITTTSADVNWNPANAETNWDIVYDTAGFDPSLGTIIALTDTTYAISGLLPNTNYDVYVRANCGTETGNWVMVNFSTECIAFTTLPFFENFDPGSQSLSCWRVINNNNDGDTWNIYTGVGYEHSGTQFAGIYTDGNGGNNNDYLISPNITLSGNQFLSFYHRVYSTYEPNDYEVLISTTGTEPADFTTVLFSDTSTLTTYDEVVLDLSAYTGDVYIAFHIPQGGLDGWYLFIDDVTIDTWPTCPSPVNLTVSNITDNSGSLAWTSRGTETAWEVQYKLVSDATWTVVQTTTNPHNLTGLTDASDYMVRVRAVCGVADSSYFTSIVNFTTACLAYTTFPIIESFDNSTSIPTCWAQSYVSGSGSLSVVSSASYPTSTPYNGTGMIYFNSYNLSSGVQTRLVSPLINSSGVSGMNVSFMWFTSTDYNTYTNEGVMVQYSLDGTNWTDAGSLIQRLNSTNAWTSQTVSLPTAVDNQNILYIGFLFVSQFGNNCLLDSIYIGAATNPIDTCDNPVNLAIPTATLACDSATANWAAGGTETMWQFEYKRNADADYTSVAVTSPTFTMTGLVQLTQYNVRVKALCGTGDESGYTTTNFTTPQCGVTSYIITASATQGGAIAPSGQISVVSGGSQTFTMTPDSGYALISLLVDGNEEGTPAVYSFNNVTNNHTIHAVFSPDGINETTLQNSIVIFPNPTNDILNVKLSQQFERVEITNMLGQVLYSNKITDATFQINTTSYSSGVYFIRLQGENGIATKKFIKE